MNHLYKLLSTFRSNVVIVFIVVMRHIIMVDVSFFFLPLIQFKSFTSGKCNYGRGVPYTLSPSLSLERNPSLRSLDNKHTVTSITQ